MGNSLDIVFIFVKTVQITWKQVYFNLCDLWIKFNLWLALINWCLLCIFQDCTNKLTKFIFLFVYTAKITQKQIHFNLLDLWINYNLKLALINLSFQRFFQVSQTHLSYLCFLFDTLSKQVYFNQYDLWINYNLKLVLIYWSLSHIFKLQQSN